MGSLMPDQQQAQVPVAVEGASEPHEELANSTSGAAYELETSGDGEARQMAASNDDTADLFGSPLPLTGDGSQVGHSVSSGSELSEQAMGDLDNDNRGLVPIHGSWVYVRRQPRPSRRHTDSADASQRHRCG